MISRNDLICPKDKWLLVREGNALLCQNCGRSYPIENDVVRTLSENDPFYEGSYNNEVRFLPRKVGLIFELPLWLITNGYEWAVRKYVKPGSCVVELGCAGGVAWFGKQYEMVGVDLSRQALEIAAQKYSLCLQANAVQLPLPDSCADAVISSYFWEHIDPAEKPKLLAEFRRILRVGGHIIFVYDVETRNPLIRMLQRQNIDLYQEAFLAQDGHVGYQSTVSNVDIFKSAGFEILESLAMERSLLQSPDVFKKMAMWSGCIGVLGRILGKLNHRLILLPYLALLRLIDETIGRILPEKWGRIARTVAIKT